MESFHGEFSKLLGYTFYIKLAFGEETKVLITPTPTVLYVKVYDKVYSVNLLASVLSLKDMVYQQEGTWLYLKIPSVGPGEIDLK